jgi:hypothetical protein
MLDQIRVRSHVRAGPRLRSSPSSPGEYTGQLEKSVNRHVGAAGDVFRRERRHRRFELLELGDVLLDKLPILPPLVEDAPDHAGDDGRIFPR